MSPRREAVTTWATALAAVLAGAAAAGALVRGGYEVPAELVAPTLVLNLAVGWSFIGVGLAARRRRPGNRTGVLMVLLGFAWLARFLVAVDTTPAFVLGVLLSSVSLSLFVHLLVTFPTGRTGSPGQRAIVVVGYLLSAPLDAVFLALGAQRGRGEGPPPNGLLITPASGEFSPEPVDLVVQAVVVVLFVSVLVSIWTRWCAAGAAARRALTPGLVGGTVVVATLLVQRTAILLFLPPSAGVVLAWSAQVVLVVWPVALLLGLLRGRLDRSGVGRLVVDLGVGSAAPAHLRAVVARALHDPTADIAYRVPGTDTYVDAAGRPADVTPCGDRAVTHLERDGEPVAVLRYDPVLTEEPDLVEAVAAGAGLAVENERLHAEVREQLAEVRASRTRLVEAADAGRRRVERDLHDGAQQRLVAVGLALRLARARLASPAEELDALLVEAGEELTAALAELRELARGIYPALLTDAGLGPALASLAERAPVPVVLEGVPPQRPPEPVEQTCYFVVSEAVTNAAKHASASRVEVSVVPDGGELRVEVADDGVGGADAEGSGLRGLADRVAAVGGQLLVSSPARGGTRVTATLPCG
ncbi:MAG: integral rane sensor signal transduction histidine kinase [Actinomycetospora sp.]|nr:integral rane sensor signal transduction histidine kinase [Actinomycetospora sp.]